MLTNTQSAQVIEELVKAAADSGEPVTITPVDEGALRAGAEALRTMDVPENLPFANETVRLALDQRDAALHEVERLRGTIRDIHTIVCEELAEPPSGTGPLVRIGTLIEERGGDTPDPRDARIAELEAALRGIWDLREKTERTYEDAYKSMFKSRGEAEWDAVDAALKEARDE